MPFKRASWNWLYCTEAHVKQHWSVHTQTWLKQTLVGLLGLAWCLNSSKATQRGMGVMGGGGERCVVLILHFFRTWLMLLDHLGLTTLCHVAMRSFYCQAGSGGLNKNVLSCWMEIKGQGRRCGNPIHCRTLQCLCKKRPELQRTIRGLPVQLQHNSNKPASDAPFHSNAPGILLQFHADETMLEAL